MRFDQEEYVACSAIYYDDGVNRGHLPLNMADKTGIVACGLRHSNCFPVLAAIFPRLDYVGKEVQGFLTSHNRFVGRKEAAKIALASGQIDKLKYLKDELDSSDLY